MVRAGPAGPLWAASTFLIAMLAGCAAEEGPLETDDGSLRAQIVDDDVPTGNQRPDAGRVMGIVLHPSGFPLAEARITVMSVDNSLMTGKNGTFAFSRVAAGQQMLRVEKEGYDTLQKPFEVLAGKVTKLEVVLGTSLDGGFTEHFHNHWRGQETYSVFEGTVAVEDGLERLPPRMCYLEYSPSCYYLFAKPGEGQIVPPGTQRVTVDIAFEPGPLFEQETMRFIMQPPRPPDGDYYGFSETIDEAQEHFEWELPVPDIVDHGHATWTGWQFMVYWPAYEYYTGGSVYNELFRSPVDVTITAHKGDLMLDPPHARPWKDSERIELETSMQTNAYCSTVEAYSCGARSPNPYIYALSDTVYCFSYCMGFAPGATVPPGTTRVAFTVEHWYSNPLAPTKGILDEDEFVIGYKTAAARPGGATWADYTWLEPIDTSQTDDGVAWTFEAPVLEGQADPYYTRASGWMLAPAVRGHEDAATWEDMACGHEVCGYPYFHLTSFVAINDDRDEMLEAGTA